MTFKHQPSKISTRWIVVADRARARILAEDAGHPSLVEVEAMSHPESRMKQSDCVSDHQGRIVGKGGVPVAVDPATDWGHRNAVEFAKQIADYLEAGRNSHKFGRLALFAAPAFLGALRNAMAATLIPMVELEVDKDYTDCSLEQMADHLSKCEVVKHI